MYNFSHVINVTFVHFVQLFMNRLFTVSFLLLLQHHGKSRSVKRHFRQNWLSEKIKDYTKICILSTTVDDLHIHKAKIDENVLFTSKPITMEFIQSIAQ